MHTMHEAIESLLQAAREYVDGNAPSGDIVAAAYRLTAVKLRERGMHDTAKDLERAAAHAEKKCATPDDRPSEYKKLFP